MSELSPIHLLIVFAIIVLLFGGDKIDKIMRGFGGGSNTGAGGPQHPVPVTGLAETKKAEKEADEKWES